MARSSILFLATSSASSICSAVNVGMRISRCMSRARVKSGSESKTEAGGVKIGAKLSSSRPGKQMPLAFKL